jgi:hypothetical protein
MRHRIERESDPARILSAMRRLLATLLVASVCAAACSAPPSGVSRIVAPDCAGAAVPLGALAPELPVWCEGTLGLADDTAQRSDDSWSDGFNTGVSHARLAASYLVFERARAASGAATTVYRTQHFVHNGHWMVDIAGHGAPAGVYEGSARDFFTGPNNGGGLMRPAMPFRFADGALVIEFDVAAGMSPYRSRVWPEIVVTTAAQPAARETNGWYAAGLFAGSPAIGCALPSDRLSECRIYDETSITAWLSAASSAGARETFGGAPTVEPLRSAWHVCAPTDADTVCRDHFRIELRRDSVSIAVNGVPYMSHRGLPAAAQLPAALLDSPVYVYFASWAYLTEDTVARVHWGRIAINPGLQLMR